MGSDPDFRIADAHLHLWDAQAYDYPWLRDRPVEFRYGDYGALPRRYLAEDYRRDAARWHITRGVHIEAEWDPTIQHSNDRSFWCQHTWNCLGPDGQLVDDFECSPARSCYEAL